VLELLDRLRQVRRATLSGALQHATDVLAAVFAADKVDAFILNPTESMLVANGTSRTPMGRRQHELGLNRIALANGGRVAWVFREQRPYLDGHVEADEMELQRARVDLGVRSAMMVPFEVDANARGVLAVVSGQPERFTEEQLHLLQFVSYWVGLVAQELNR
jgi:transcriptional regulator with GAF, ATPase, and Fis domain